MIEADKKVITHINWLAVDFDIVEQSVKILQNRIVKAKLASRSRMVKKLQSLLVKSLNARIGHLYIKVPNATCDLKVA